MKLIAVVSAKGGVGKTTVTANLAAAFARSGRHILLVDLDPQNALRFHLGINPREVCGSARATLGDGTWADACVVAPNGVVLLPYGVINEDDRSDFETILVADPHWLRRNLEALGLPPDTCVLIDTPPGPSVYLRQALGAANLALIVSLADAASYATLPMMDSLVHDYCLENANFIGCTHVINQIDSTAQLSLDVTQVLRHKLVNRIAGTVQRDQAVSEALAFERSVLDYREESRAAHDFIALSQVIHALLTATPSST